MNILFLTMSNFNSLFEHGIYPDLIRNLARKGNRMTVLLPCEKRNRDNVGCEVYGHVKVIKVLTGNLFNVSMLKKLVSRIELLSRYRRALKRYAKEEKYDLILSSTPPTILFPLINKIKRKDGAYSFLMLKDIFPQNAVDLGMISDGGVIHRFLRMFEKKLYASSDAIGCMSPANIEYLKRQDDWIDNEKITLCPNALELLPIVPINKDSVRTKYGIPKDKIVFVYGGSLGRPQGIEFFEECIRRIGYSDKFMFLVIGDGAYLDELKELSLQYKEILKVIQWLPTEEFANVVSSCDVGLILLDSNFKIPNFPSRLLEYLRAGLPVLSATDENCDVGIISKNNGFGYWCKSDDTSEFIRLLDEFINAEKRYEMGQNARNFFISNYDVDIIADKIMNFVLSHRGSCK